MITKGDYIEPISRGKKRQNQKNAYGRMDHADVSDIFQLGEDGQPAKDVPKILHTDRRESCRLSFRNFLTTYKPERYRLRFSADHELLIETVQQSVLDAMLQLIVFPRGSGKTSICRDAVEWATLYGHKRFPMLFAAEASKSKQHMTAIKNDLLSNQLLFEDFPEVCYPIRECEGIANRANYQRYKGVHTGLRWGGSQVVFADIPQAREAGNAGAVIGVGTITGSASRGPLVNDLRPDYALIDDPQTRKSADSETQTQERMDIINGDILGMAGPDRAMSAVMTATVIYKGDLADRFLNKDEHPEWNGIRVSMIKQWPTNRELWDQWNDIRKACVVDERSLDQCHEFYRANQEAMDEGGEVYWADRITPGYLSALESAMGAYYRDPVTFASEYQNEPLEMVQDQSKLPAIEDIVKKQHGSDRGIIPDDADMLVAMVDVQQSVLYWAVAAFRTNFTGYVIDYGTFPDQQRAYFGLRDIRRTIYHAKPGAGFEGALYHCLGTLLDQLEDGRYHRRTGESLPISAGLVDANYGQSTDTVYKVISERGPNTPWLPSHGKGVKATQKPFSDYVKKPGDRVGLNWRSPRLDVNTRRVRHVIYETNWWKSFHAQRWAIALNERGSLSLYRDGKHRMFAEHLHAEYGVLVEANGRKVTEFFEKPGSPDNHFLDLSVGCCVAASIAGCVPEGVFTEKTKKGNGKALTKDFLQNRGRQ